MSKCMECGLEVESKGTKPVKYCSDKCRKAYGREKRRIIAQAYRAEAIATGQVETDNLQTDKPANYGQPDCQCQHCQNVRASGNPFKRVLNHGEYKTASQLDRNELNRVSLPGDADYDGVCLGSNAALSLPRLAQVAITKEIR